MTRTRKKYSAEFKLKAVIEILKGEKTAAQLAGELGVHPLVLSDWKKHFLETGAQIFETPRKALGVQQEAKEKSELFEQIGRLKMENEWLKKKIGSFDLDARKALLEPGNEEMSQRRQCRLLSIHRSGLYYEPKEVSAETLRLMQAIDEEYLRHPYYGRRRMTIALRRQGFEVGQTAIRTAMRTMGLEAIGPKPSLSVGDQEHKKFPYLLRGLSVVHSDQVWAADITYVPLPKGFGYLFAMIDWFSRYGVEWELSNLLDTEFCMEALERGLARRKPEIFNTDQGVQFTSHRLIERLEKDGVRISMDGKGRALDNVFVERLWRTVKYEDIYPRGYESLKEVKEGLKKYFKYYNEERPHQGLDYRTPAEVYHRV